MNKLLENFNQFLKIKKFRENSKGWFKGYIFIPSDFGMFGKQIKLVNLKLKYRFYQ